MEYFYCKNLAKVATSLLSFLMVMILLARPSYAKLSDGTSLKIASWNVQNLGGKCGGIDKGGNADIAELIADVISPYDIIFLQEVANRQNISTSSTQSTDDEDVDECETEDEEEYDDEDVCIIDGEPYDSTTYNAASNTTACVGGNDVASFKKLCDVELISENYTCDNIDVIVTDPCNCETYVVLYKKILNLDVELEYTGDADVVPHIEPTTSIYSGGMKRPPMKASITLDNKKNMTVYSVHTSPSVNIDELNVFYDAIKPDETNPNNNGDQNVIALGDFNAGCSYLSGGFATYNENNQAAPLFPLENTEYSLEKDLWDYVIPDNYRTNLATTRNCAYDRIMLNQAIKHSYNFTCTDQITDPNAAPLTSTNTTSQAYYNTYANQTANCVVPKTPDLATFTSATSQALSPTYSELYFNEIKSVGTTGLEKSEPGVNTTKKLSDHGLVWSQFYFGGIVPTDGLEQENYNFVNHGDSKAIVYFKGNNFRTDATFAVYVQSIVFPVESSDIVDLTTKVTDVTVSSDSLITQTALGTYDPGQYLIVVDVDNDGKYNKNIDVQDYFTVEEREQEQDGYIGVYADIATDSNDYHKNKKPRIFETGESIIVAGSYNNSDNPDGSVGGLMIINADTDNVIDVIANVSTDNAFSSFEYKFEEGLDQGTYNIMFHPYEKGTLVYNPEYDLIDYEDQIGFIVTDSTDGSNNLVTLNTKGETAENFVISDNENIYIMAKNLPANEVVDIYVVESDEIIDAEQDASIELSNIAVPLTLDDIDQDVATIEIQTADSKGQLFMAVIKNPASFMDDDYVNKWGKKLNVVIDVNRNGLYDIGDFIDTQEVDEIIANIDNVAENSEATLQYQELLNATLSGDELVLDGIYGDNTKKASIGYICSDSLDASMATAITNDSKVGFKILLDEDILADTTLTGDIYNLASGEFDDTVSSSDISSFVVAKEDVTINGLSSTSGSTILLCSKDSIILSSDIVTNDLKIISDKISIENGASLTVGQGDSGGQLTISVHDEL